jgi:hypothetical protein
MSWSAARFLGFVRGEPIDIFKTSAMPANVVTGRSHSGIDVQTLWASAEMNS